MSRIFCSVLAAGLVVGLSLSAEADPPEIYRAVLVPLNNSGVSGQALLKLEGDQLTVHINARGLEANKPHPQHIHGFGDGTNTTLPTLEQDDDEDGFVELAEGLDTYGPVLVPLTSPPGGALADYPTAPNGTIHFKQTYILSADQQASLGDLTLNEIVVHGMTLDAGDGSNGGEANGTAGYKATLPVASGVIVTKGNGNARK